MDAPKAQAITDQLMQLVMQGAKLSHALPSAEDQAYYISLYPELRPLIDTVQKNCIDLTQSLLEVNRSATTTIPQLNYKDNEEILDKYNDVVFVTDEKLELIDNYFDSIQGNQNKMQTTLQIDTINTGNKIYHVHRASNVQRPQLNFEPIDNSTSIFIPKLSTKYNAKISLEEVWKNYDKIIKQDQLLSAKNTDGQRETLCLPSPYEYEIDNYEFLPSQSMPRKEILYKSTEATPLTWVDNPEKLRLMSDKLEAVEEIAVDLEHHAYRSYQGFTCLIQISTRTEDFIVDALVLRSELIILNRSFTNPNIVKILHGSDNDILWLQRDFGVYIVNLFDTGQAARSLEYPKLSLSYLLENFCSITAEKKKFQLADWRIRPLPEDMLAYARSDTHYLNSRAICKRAYQKDIFQQTLVSVQRKCPSFNPTQTSVLTALFDWRDFFAREEDESVRYILPNHMMIRIAELLPQDPIELFSCCNPQPPPFIKANATDLIKVIKDTMANKGSQLVKPKSVQTLPPFKQNAEKMPKPEADMFKQTNPISQEELFQKADWYEGNKRTALLPSLGDSMSTAASFFSPTKDKQTETNSKLSALNNSLESSFCFGPSSSVPNTMEEIYQFSNANRKRNKEKKKLKEDSIKAGPVSPIKFGEDPSPKKQENPQEFMKKIGWLNEDVAPLIPSTTKKGPGNDNSKKNQKKGNLLPMITQSIRIQIMVFVKKYQIRHETKKEEPKNLILSKFLIMVEHQPGSLLQNLVNGTNLLSLKGNEGNESTKLMLPRLNTEVIQNFNKY
eukprot:CAMPEP_0117082040 /NCGR_PEP_ID=MMETSP0472-20121206/57798_1 /TAXON_ID=693140 ORGANISM="Tiarina fusus, Strain LIS" /NCGR_SAMPLE_ID=MMETSP0472 /ASSEMBLY_ACC=CAM_ASM_000603 /LENGTH=785 /DNA_ID=CAMNT_0004810167 /DNA_START=90 /DNA_END=2445 /DNA_ORIENTATION=-